MKKIKTFCLLLLTLQCTLSCGNTPPTVNILSWFGYLSIPEISQLVKQECHAVLSVDEYYSNEEFLRRWKAQKDDYDLIFFANLLYQGMKNSIILPKADLTAVIENYHPVIKQHYLQENYPKNIVFFSHSLMGFLWNPKIIQLSKHDDMFSVFQKAKTHQVIVIARTNHLVPHSFTM